MENELQRNAAPTTTAEHDRVTAGQREVNLKWENTQQCIALLVTCMSLVVATWLAIGPQKDGTKQEAAQLAACVFLYGVANLVIGFYFGRTNHQRVGGIATDYLGR